MNTNEQISMVGLRFIPLGRVVFFLSSEFELEAGIVVEVEAEGRMRRGTVVIAPSQVEVNQVTGELDTVTTTIPSVG